MNLGHPADSRPKGTEDPSMAEKPRTDEVSESVARRDPRGRAKAEWPEAQSRSAELRAPHQADSTCGHPVHPQEPTGDGSPPGGIPTDDVGRREE